MAAAAAVDTPVLDGRRSGRFWFPWRLVIEKIPLLVPVGRFLRGDRCGPGRCLGDHRGHSLVVADGQCPDLLCRLPGPVFLSAGLGGLVSPSRTRFAAVEGLRGVPGPGGHHGGSPSLEAEVSVPACRLALVSGNVGAGDRASAVRTPISGRPLHVLAADRAVHWLGVGGGRRIRDFRRIVAGCALPRRHWSWRF